MIACVALTAPTTAAPTRVTGRAAERALDAALFAQAHETARLALDTQALVRTPEERAPMVIVRQPHGAYAVYSADAWAEPEHHDGIAWPVPTGDPVATVALDGTVHRH